MAINAGSERPSMVFFIGQYGKDYMWDRISSDTLNKTK